MLPCVLKKCHIGSLSIPTVYDLYLQYLLMPFLPVFMRYKTTLYLAYIYPLSIPTHAFLYIPSLLLPLPTDTNIEGANTSIDRYTYVGS